MGAYFPSARHQKSASRKPFILAGVIQKISPSPKSPAAGNWTTDFADQLGPIPGALILMAIPLGIWRRPLQVDSPLPTMSLPLTVHAAIPVHLEETYMRTAAGVYPT